MKNNLSLFLLSALLLPSCFQNSSTKQINFDSVLYNLNDSSRYNIIDTSGLNNVDTIYMHTGFYFLTNGENGIRKREEKSDEIYTIAPKPFASVDNIIKTNLEKSKLENGEIYNELCLTFDAKGTKDIQEGTKKSLHSKIAIIVANKLLYVIKVEAIIKTGVMYIGLNDYSEKEMADMQNAVDRKK